MNSERIFEMEWFSVARSEDERADVLPADIFTKSVKLLVGFKPKNFCQRRLHLLSLIMLDVGCRVSECIF